MFELARRNRYRERCRERDNKVGLNTINTGSIANPRNLCHMISINPPISVYSIQLIGKRKNCFMSSWFVLLKLRIVCKNHQGLGFMSVSVSPIYTDFNTLGP